ncbi:hypothetical protein [Nocardia wallacei]|uniref:hypothetical protein n=1 Tax=Nocardia wallacei TaxID=480035 RepID=UPI0024559229|nr:hypothetical protein [Nocardia wallacei]
MSRYDSAEHLYDWQRSGRYPKIHDDIYNLIRSEVDLTDGALLDLGSSTGLLARRLEGTGFNVTAIEADAKAIEAGKAAGTYGRGCAVCPWTLTPDEMPKLFDFIDSRRIRIVVARRVLPELDNAGVTPAMLGATLANAGVRHLFLEGRAPRQGATHRLRSVTDEIAELEKCWQTVTFDGKHRIYLTVKE